MNILFVFKKDALSSVEPLGVLYLSSYLKRYGHNVFISDSSIVDIKKVAEKETIGIIGISCTNTDYKFFLNFSKKLKKDFPRIPIIWGGPTPTFNPEVIKQKPIDIICRGEGEIALLELLNRLERKQNINTIPNLWIKKQARIYKNDVSPSIDDLDTLPFPDHSLIYKFPQFKYSPIKFVMASRGCPFNCSFCYNYKFHELYKGKGRIIRTRSVDNVISELEMLKKENNAKFFYFLDDVFPFKEEWIATFVKEYLRKIRVPFTIVTSVAFVSEYFVKNLSKAGCISIHLAIECGSDKIRKEILNKPLTNKQIIKACNLAHKYNIAISAYNMVGIPFTNFKDDVETLDLNLKSKVDATYVSFCLPFLDTRLGQMAYRKGLISKKTEFNSWFERVVIQMGDKDKIERFAHLFTLIVLMPKLRPHLDILLELPFPGTLLRFLKDLINGYNLKTKIVPVRASYKEYMVTAFYFIWKRFTK